LARCGPTTMPTSSDWHDAVIERVVLVGFMCSGKTSVGRALAQRLSWEFVDFDEEIERDQGKLVAHIFREHGEDRFRRLEAELTEKLRDRRDVVLAPGGGWVTQPELVARLRPASLIVWLQVSPAVVLERAGRQPTVERPLLAVDDPDEAIRSLLSARLPFYREADYTVATDNRDPAAVAAEIAELLHR
jgi:shikimate kinase